MVMTTAAIDSRDGGAAGAASRVIVVTGATWALGRRVLELLEKSGYDNVFAGDPAGSADDLPEHIDCLVHLAPGDHDALVRRRASAVAGTPELLAAIETRQASHVVLLSSALVYGAWPNNPVPITEDSVLRPDNRFVFARQLATVEQLVDDWRRGAPERAACVLRPVPAMAEGGTTSLVAALAAGIGGRASEDEIPAQFVHLDDVASAVVLAIEARLDGVYNVAPDGHVPGPRVTALSGGRPRLGLPDRLNDWIGDLRWRFQRGPIPPGLRPYTRSPWLVANDRLRDAGWQPTVTNEQAFVEGTEARWWTMLTPKRKQELSLALMVGAIVGMVGLLINTIRRARRRYG